LLEQFGSPRKLRAVPDEELRNVVNRRQAQRLREYLSEQAGSTTDEAASRR